LRARDQNVEPKVFFNVKIMAFFERIGDTKSKDIVKILYEKLNDDNEIFPV